MRLLKLMEVFDPTVKSNDIHYKKLVETIKFLETKKRVLLLTTSNRGEWAEKKLEEVPKSTQLAKVIEDYLGKDKCVLIEVPKLNIYSCEGNVSHEDGNSCGVKEAILKNKKKNPSGEHRCWRNINNPDDELWKISKELFESDVVLFFGSIRWGQMNSYYQKLIERLTWLENRHTTFKEKNILKGKNSGLIVIGQNWRGEETVKVQKEVHRFFGFDINDDLYWNWQYTKNPNDESQKGYKDSIKEFKDTFDLD